MHSQFAASPEFQRLVLGCENVELARIALEIARDAYPDLDIDAYLKRIEAFAERVRERCRAAATPREILGQINWVLFVEERLQGNEEDYYDPRNSYLNEVLDRRLGIPISLSVLYWSIGQQLRLAVEGVNFPMHFMLRVEEHGETYFVDPFRSGAILDRRGCEKRLSEIAEKPVVLTETLTAPCSYKVVVARMLRNLKGIYWNAHDMAAALPVQRRLAALDCTSPVELRDLAVLCTQMHHLGDAIDSFQAYLKAAPEADDANEIRALIAALERQVARWN